MCWDKNKEIRMKAKPSKNIRPKNMKKHHWCFFYDLFMLFFNLNFLSL